MNCIILMTRGVASDPIITDTESDAHHTFDIIAREYLGEDFDRVVGESYNGIIDSYCYDHVNEHLAMSGIEILLFTNLHVKK